eukprot:437516_1
MSLKRIFILMVSVSITKLFASRLCTYKCSDENYRHYCSDLKELCHTLQEFTINNITKVCDLFGYQNLGNITYCESYGRKEQTRSLYCVYCNETLCVPSGGVCPLISPINQYQLFHIPQWFDNITECENHINNILSNEFTECKQNVDNSVTSKPILSIATMIGILIALCVIVIVCIGIFVFYHRVTVSKISKLQTTNSKQDAEIQKLKDDHERTKTELSILSTNFTESHVDSIVHNTGIISDLEKQEGVADTTSL